LLSTSSDTSSKPPYSKSALREDDRLFIDDYEASSSYDEEDDKKDGSFSLPQRSMMPGCARKRASESFPRPAKKAKITIRKSEGLVVGLDLSEAMKLRMDQWARNNGRKSEGNKPDPKGGDIERCDFEIEKIVEPEIERDEAPGGKISARAEDAPVEQVKEQELAIKRSNPEKEMVKSIDDQYGDGPEYALMMRDRDLALQDKKCDMELKERDTMNTRKLLRMQIIKEGLAKGEDHAKIKDCLDMFEL
jgi:hypothetical protein